MRIPVLAVRGSGALETREERKKNAFYVIGIVVVAIITILIVTYLLTQRIRRQSGLRRSQPKSKNGRLPSLFRKMWGVTDRGRRNHDYSTTPQDNEMDGPGRESRDREMSGASRDPERQSVASGAGVDRNTSIRSVMTLPAYSPAARENERILGREGERGGIDTVVEFPETQDDEEQRREGEMESLYQIRLARRQEARDREERREARRQARLRGDMEALAEIRRRADAAAEESRSQILIAEHQSANRDRRVPSVQYGDLGIARHDGTRLRANSTESDNRPLLDSAASISGQSARSRALSTNTLHTHTRGLSASSLLSSRASEDSDFPRDRDRDDDFEVVSLQSSYPSQNPSNPRSRSRSVSRATTPLPPPSIEIPRDDAPAYEDPPNYETPIETRAPQLPGLARLPSIQVTDEHMGNGVGDGDGDGRRSASPR